MFGVKNCILVCCVLTFTIVATQGSWFGDLSISPESLSKFFKSVGEAFGGLIPCVYQCPPGFAAVAKRGYHPKANGCGTESHVFTAELAQYLPAVDQCCKEHDVCYGTCNKVKMECDQRFRKCLKDVCSLSKQFEKLVGSNVDLQGKCVVGVNALFTLVTAAGCPAFQNAQGQGCNCVKLEL